VPAHASYPPHSAQSGVMALDLDHRGGSWMRSSSRFTATIRQRPICRLLTACVAERLTTSYLVSKEREGCP
jgi:hypothetical protein